MPNRFSTFPLIPRRKACRLASAVLLCLLAQRSLVAQVKNANTDNSASKTTAADTTDGERLNDQTIMLAVDDELRRAESVDGHRIDVDVEGGIVTLSGHVNHLLAKRIAVGLAERIRGVITVLDEIAVNITDHDDAQTKANILAALQAHPATQKLTPEVSVDRGSVKLGGVAVNTGQKILAEELAASVSGVVEMTNEMNVKQATMSDEEMKDEIDGLIGNSTFLDDSEIQCEVKDGKVILTGQVARASQRSYADLQAFHAGAKSVDSRGIRVNGRHSNPLLRQKRYTRAKDADVQTAIERAFKYDPRLLSVAPQVAVKGGTATLTGSVEYLSSKQAAEQAAKHTIGVRRVKNNIKVRMLDAPTDKQLVEFARLALRRDPYVDRHDIEVDCRNAHVGLYGVVDTDFEKAHAHWIASQLRGVVHVNDYLSVRKKWIPKSDAAIQADLREKLTFDFVGPGNQVRATVKNGVAILEGKVDTWFMWQAAMDDALACGAREPHNLIEVRYGQPAGPHYFGPHYYIPR